MVDGPCEQFRKRNDEKGWSNAAPASFYILGANRTCPSSSTSLLGITRDWIRVYRDNYRARSGGAWNDPDYDGLSTDLENIIGTIPINTSNSTTSGPSGADSDQDGIMDGLEVYGPIWDVRDWSSGGVPPSYTMRAYLPLPWYGASPLQKNLVIEVDKQQTHRVNDADIWSSLDITYEAFAEANVHTLLIENGPNRINVISDTYEVTDPISGGTTNLGALASVDIAVLRDELAGSFDLIDYPFMRRVMWVSNYDGGSCGVSEMVTQSAGANLLNLLPFGLYAVDDCAGPSLTHEIGHMIGLYHTGHGPFYQKSIPLQLPSGTVLKSEYNKQPNYWSVMSYGTTIPIHSLADGTTVDGDMELRSRTWGMPPRPAHFSREEMISLDEEHLYEWNGLMGHDIVPGVGNIPRTFVFDDRDVWVGANNYVGELPVNWVDWNRNHLNDTSTSWPGIEDTAIEGDVCIQWNTASGLRYINPVTGAIGASASDQSVCPDHLSGSNDLDYISTLDLSAFVFTQPDGGTQFQMTTGMKPRDANWPSACTTPSTLVRWWCGSTVPIRSFYVPQHEVD
jgi:hypothetical protein